MPAKDIVIHHEPPDASGRGRYVAPLPGGAEAYLSYRRLPHGIVSADSTFTPPEHRGGGHAIRLVERLAADARAEGLKIRPVCWFVAKWLDRHPDWLDVREG